MKKLFKSVTIIGVVTVSLAGCVPVYYTQPATTYVQPAQPVQTVTVVQPDWYPANDNMINYYYFPDYAMYYDVRNGEYVTMENGSWYFSPQVPAMYASYDLRNSYVVALNYSVHQPWMHHSLYVSHYPPYYYKSYYGNNDEYTRMRGFNENDRHAYYRSSTNSYQTVQPREERTESYPRNNAVQQNNATTQPATGVPFGRNRYEAPATQNNQTNSNQTARPEVEQHTQQNASRVETVNNPAVQQPVDTRRSMPVSYSHPDVGQPVKVTRNMTPPRNAPASQPSNTRPAGNQNQKENSQERR